MNLSLVFVAIASNLFHAPQCTPNSPTQPFTLWTYEPGALQDRSRFAEAVGEVSRPFTNDVQVRPSGVGGRLLTPRFVEGLIDEASNEFVSDVESRSGRTYSQKDLVADFREFRKGQPTSYKGARDVYITRVEEEIHCADRSVTIRVKGVYAVVPRIVGPSVLGGMRSVIDKDQVMQFAPDGQGGGSLTVRVFNIIDLARSNPSVRTELKRGVDRFYALPQAAQRLRLADEYTRTLIEHVRRTGEVPIEGFEPGDYGIPSFMVAVLQEVVMPELIAFIQKSRSPVEIASIGHTDDAVVHRPIEYSGCGILTRARGQVIPFDPRTPCRASPYIRNNDQLSFARAFEGAALLHQLLSETPYGNRIRYTYTGQGSTQASQNRKESRRIIYRITSRDWHP